MSWIKPIDIYDFCGEETGYEATKSIDSNLGTAWKHDYSHHHTIVFDFGYSLKAIRVRLYTLPEHWPGGLTLWISDDPNNYGDPVWTGALTTVGTTTWRESGRFYKEGRYIKVESITDVSGYTRIYEFEALESISALKQRLLISDITYDEELDDALDEATRYALIHILTYNPEFTISEMVDTALFDAVLDIAAGIFKRRHMPQDMDQGWWAQGIKKLENYITATYKVPTVYFSEE